MEANRMDREVKKRLIHAIIEIANVKKTLPPGDVHAKNLLDNALVAAVDAVENLIRKYPGQWQKTE